ncbi:MAG: fasciclin domain-containing protein [Pseudomonadota bacterium]
MIHKPQWLTTWAAAGVLMLGSAGAAAQSASEWERDDPSEQQQSEAPDTGSTADTSADAMSQDDTRQQAGQQGQGSQELEQLAEQHQDLKSFVEAVNAAGMGDALTQGRYTVFAPTDEAFQQATGKSLDELMQPENREELVSLLRAHIVADDVDPEMAQTIGQARTIDGGDLALEGGGEQLQVGDARVVESDIQQGNMRVYAIDGVLSPSAAGTGIAAADDGETDSAAAEETRTAQAGSFDELDTDGDGYLSEEELQASEQDLQADEIDSDADGRVSRSEFAAFEGSESDASEPAGTDAEESQDDEGMFSTEDDEATESDY